MQILPSVASLLSKYPVFLLDAFGVFWQGNALGFYEGALLQMEEMVRLGKQVGIISNSSAPVSKEKEKYRQAGLLEGVHYHFLLTSGELVKEAFLENNLPIKGKKFWAFGKGHPKFSYDALFEGSSYEETSDLNLADFIFLGIPHIKGEDQLDPQIFLKEIERLASYQLPMVCANPDLFAYEGNPPKPFVRQGSIAALYEQLGGKVIYFGKPYKAIFERALRQVRSFSKEEIIMIGDTPETDIRGAVSIGLKSALLLQTGMMGKRVQEMGVKKAVEELKKTDYPDFFLTRFVL